MCELEELKKRIIILEKRIINNEIKSKKISLEYHMEKFKDFLHKNIDIDISHYIKELDDLSFYYYD